LSRELRSVAGLRGQESALRAFRAALAEDSSPARVAGAYLLHGPEGVGRGLGAAGFATALLCREPRGLLPCGRCKPCGWNTAGTHPDLVAVSAETGPFFKDDAEALRAGPGHFTRAHHDSQKVRARRRIPVRAIRRLLDILSLSAAGGGRKVAVIDSLDEIEEEGVATLLKSLEEPPPSTTFLVLAGGVDNVPDTILSRCQRVRFRPLAPDVVRELLLADVAPDDRPADDAIDLLVRLAQGSAGRALRGARIGLHHQAPLALRGLLRPEGPRGVDDACAWVHAAGRDLAEQRIRTRELLALTLLLARDRAATSGRADELDAVLPALTSGFESVGANVSPDLVLHALWARVARARR